MVGCCSYAMLPGIREDAVEARKKRTIASRGCAICEGPSRRLGWWWFTSFHGLEYMQLYLWLVKDWSWSQLHWFYPAMISGTLAMIWIIMLICLALYKKVYAEAYIGFGLLLWLSANYVWMVGELWDDNVIEDDDEGKEFYNNMYVLSKYICTIGVIWVTSYFVIIRPMDCFKNDRLHPVMLEIADDCPPHPFPKFFRDFREYEHMHLLLWSYKDLAWVWNFPSVYLFFFVLAVLFNCDLLVRYAIYKNQWIDFWHYVSLLFWLFANGIWAAGELYLEDEEELEAADWKNYTWPSMEGVHPNFKLRHLSPYFFLASAGTLVLFYIFWILSSCCSCLRATARVDYGSTAFDSQDEGHEESNHTDVQLTKL